MQHAILFFLLITYIGSVTAQNTIVTDRPDFTESASTLGAGQLQIESGTLIEIEDQNKTWTLNTTLFRYGIRKNLELRLVTELVQTKDRIDFRRKGIADLQLGVKYRIIEGPIQVSYLGHVFFPTGSEYFTNDGLGVSNKIALDGTLSERVSTGINLGVDLFREADPSYSYTWAVGISLTEKVGYFAEIFGDFANTNTINSYYDMGFTYLVSNDLQLDFSFGGDLDSSRDYNFWSAGVSWRVSE